MHLDQMRENFRARQSGGEPEIDHDDLSLVFQDQVGKVLVFADFDSGLGRFILRKAIRAAEKNQDEARTYGPCSHY
jgi:hypothetical protein